MKAHWRLTAVRPAALRLNALRLTLVPALALMTFVAPGQSHTTPLDLPSTQESAASAPAEDALAVRPQGRLRKLHLVRPDLIPYPIAHEVYC